MTLVAKKEQKGEEGGRKKEVATPPAFAKLYLGAHAQLQEQLHMASCHVYVCTFIRNIV